MGFSKKEAIGAVVGGFVADTSVEKVATALGIGHRDLCCLSRLKRRRVDVVRDSCLAGLHRS